LSFSIETLQDFVMNLMNDEAAKTAYAADPLSALKDAGLADLTPADVEEVLPLVADSLPAGVPGLGDLPLDSLPLDSLPMDSLPLDSLPMDSLPGLDGLPGLDSLPAGVPSLPGLPGLDSLPAGVPSLGALPGLGDLPLDVPSLPVALPAVPTLETPLGDVTAVVDGAAARVGLDGDTLSTATSAFASNADNSDAPTVSNITETAFGDLAAGGKIDADEFGGSVAGSSDLADAGLGLVGHSGGDVAAWGSLDSVAGDLGGGLLAGPDGAAFAAESPLGNVDFNTNGDFSIEPANAADLLDVDHLGDTGDAVAATVAHYVGTGTDAVTGGVANGGDTLAGFLAGGPAAPLGGLVETGTDTVTEGLQTGGDMLSEHLTNLPAVDGLPLDQLPELPQLPDLPAIDSDSLPHAPGLGDLPVDLPSLPVELPDTSAVTDIVSHNPVTEAVHASPVGGLVDGLGGHLPSVADLPVGDLDLGL
jgi:hypothetical protein